MHDIARMCSPDKIETNFLFFAQTPAEKIFSLACEKYFFYIYKKKTPDNFIEGANQASLTFEKQ